MRVEQSSWTSSRVRRASLAHPDKTVRRASLDPQASVDPSVNEDHPDSRATKAKPVPRDDQVRWANVVRRVSKAVPPAWPSASRVKRVLLDVPDALVHLVAKVFPAIAPSTFSVVRT